MITHCQIRLCFFCRLLSRSYYWLGKDAVISGGDAFHRIYRIAHCGGGRADLKPSTRDPRGRELVKGRLAQAGTFRLILTKLLYPGRCAPTHSLTRSHSAK